MINFTRDRRGGEKLGFSALWPIFLKKGRPSSVVLFLGLVRGNVHANSLFLLLFAYVWCSPFVRISWESLGCKNVLLHTEKLAVKIYNFINRGDVCLKVTFTSWFEFVTDELMVLSPGCLQREKQQIRWRKRIEMTVTAE